MSKSSEVVSGGTSVSATAAGPPNASAVAASVEEGGRGTVPEGLKDV